MHIFYNNTWFYTDFRCPNGLRIIIINKLQIDIEKAVNYF